MAADPATFYFEVSDSQMGSVSPTRAYLGVNTCYYNGNILYVTAGGGTSATNYSVAATVTPNAGYAVVKWIFSDGGP